MSKWKFEYHFLVIDNRNAVFNMVDGFNSQAELFEHIFKQMGTENIKCIQILSIEENVVDPDPIGDEK